MISGQSDISKCTHWSLPREELAWVVWKLYKSFPCMES